MIEHFMYEPLSYYVSHLFELLAFCMEQGIDSSTDVEDVEYYTHFEDEEGTLCSSLERFSEDVICQYLKKEGWGVSIDYSALALPDEEYSEMCEHLDYRDVVLEYNQISAEMSHYEFFKYVIDIFTGMTEFYYDCPVFGGFVGAYIISKDGATLEQLHKLGSCLCADEGAYRIWDGKLVLASFPVCFNSDFYMNDTFVDVLFSLVKIGELKSCLN